eukprot:TRINITY_DN8806_c0_g1_i4.p1 TRINITY_DN8806_c0_g1~~TRINITY_DN8806_c0_g1_i4.p1  ORF type:complete len:132 (-),score=24.27 TRINITY_DN8806_c0_g1_i4:243-638(-)
MGVTAIETHKQNRNYLLVGSYDESVTVWDLRKPNLSLSKLFLGGGIWRIKSNQLDTHVVVAAMRGFFHLINFDGTQLSLIATHSKPHESENLCYGIDRKHYSVGEIPEVNDYVIASVSFYDNLLTIWKPNV